MNDAFRLSRDDSTEPDAAQPRVAVYMSGHEPATLDHQEAALRSYLDTHQPQWMVVAAYCDLTTTRGWRGPRPAVARMLSAAASGAFDLLLVHRLDRLSRRMDHLDQIVEALDAAAVTLHTVDEPLDSTAPAPRLIRRLWVTLTAYKHRIGIERSMQRRRAARRDQRSAAHAQPPNSAPPRCRTNEGLAAPDGLEATADNPAPEVSMNRVTREIDRGTRTVDGVQVQITELVWADEGRSFEVHRTDTGADLTEDGCFDTWPTDEEITDLLRTVEDLWSCPGCGTSIDASQADLVVDHVRDCDRVDGAGQPVRGAR